MSDRSWVVRWWIAAGLLAGFSAFPVYSEEPPDTNSPVLHVLLSGDPHAPTPEQVVDAVEERGELPLQGLRAIPPERAGYAWPGRAQGDAARWLRENPDSTRAVLERYVVLTYAPQVDLTRAIESFRSDAYVVTAYIPKEARFSSVELTGFGIDYAPFGSTDTQYGRAALNIDAAWSLASGYALIGVPDTGLKMDHPALRQFSSSGAYVGGNFIPASQPTSALPAISPAGDPTWCPTTTSTSCSRST